MGLTEVINRLAISRAHVLIVEVPGNWWGRVRLEAMIVRRGWHIAMSPADADVLAVCGVPGGELEDVVARLWDQMPGPRVRVDVTADRDDVQHALETAARALQDTRRHQEDAHDRPFVLPVEDSEEGADEDHGDMDHGDMEMAPDGIALAGGAEDRDGLEMDVLHVRLGPVLPHWPAGLVIDTTLHGDVIVEATGRRVRPSSTADGGRAGRWSEGRGAREVDQVWRWDNVAAVLSLAGWQEAALQAQSCRNDLVHGEDTEDVYARVALLLRRITRSRSLRWSLRGVGPISAETCRHLGLPGLSEGDSYDRLKAMLDRCSPGTPCGSTEPGGRSAPGLAAVASVLVGVDLAVARVVLATLDLPPDWVLAQEARDG